MPEPYVLTVASHKGGSGRTTTALAVAWALGQAGRAVTLIDADEQRSARLMALDARGQCTWKNVTFRAGPEALFGQRTGDVIVIDPPALTSPSVQAIMSQTHGIMLTCLADPLSLRTIPAAATVIEKTKDHNPQLELLGIAICIYNAASAVQNAMLERLIEAHSELLLSPVIPFQTEMRLWPLQPGSAPPAGPARDAYQGLATNLDRAMRTLESGVAS